MKDTNNYVVSIKDENGECILNVIFQGIHRERGQFILESFYKKLPNAVPFGRNIEIKFIDLPFLGEINGSKGTIDDLNLWEVNNDFYMPYPYFSPILSWEETEKAIKYWAAKIYGKNSDMFKNFGNFLLGANGIEIEPWFHKIKDNINSDILRDFGNFLLDIDGVEVPPSFIENYIMLCQQHFKIQIIVEEK